MSIAQAQRIKELERDVLELSRAITDSQALIKDLAARIERIEQARRPGPKPKESNG